ncbi:alpha/beta hydrolase fold domain-containing protein [Seohaeicola saemankumensis]|nr:alpha/beta hydrolase [Seohaeicola saemankumensis]MCA0871049.1 alpha/beta hydrolase fold domain-containing protein [Seohaeicola saemankumensis]
MSWRRVLLNGALRRIEKPYLAREQDPLRLRAGFERRAPLIFRMPRGVASRWIDLHGVPALHLGPPIGAGPVMFYLHGCAFVMGSPRTHSAMIARLVQLTGCPAVLPRYRLAPEHPFPAAIEDAQAAYSGLCRGGVPPGRIVLGGDSAGGGLVLSLLAQICTGGDATLKGVAGWIRQRWYGRAES